MCMQSKTEHSYYLQTKSMRIVSLKRESNFKHTHVYAEQDRVMRIGPRQKCMRMDTGSLSERTEYWLYLSMKAPAL